MKTILITGASTGIGKAIGEHLTSRGHRVFGTSRNPAQYPDSTFELLPLDVRDSKSIQALF